eukprot:2693609-Prymnesium_polylepis.1
MPQQRSSRAASPARLHRKRSDTEAGVIYVVFETRFPGERSPLAHSAMLCRDRTSRVELASAHWT